MKRDQNQVEEIEKYVLMIMFNSVLRLTTNDTKCIYTANDTHRFEEHFQAFSVLVREGRGGIVIVC